MPTTFVRGQPECIPNPKPYPLTRGDGRHRRLGACCEGRRGPPAGEDANRTHFTLSTYQGQQTPRPTGCLLCQHKSNTNRSCSLTRGDRRHGRLGARGEGRRGPPAGEDAGGDGGLGAAMAGVDGRVGAARQDAHAADGQQAEEQAAADALQG